MFDEEFKDSLVQALSDGNLTLLEVLELLIEFLEINEESDS